MNLLITGGAGFIGSNFIHYILEKYPDYKIVNLDLLTYAGNLENLKSVENNPNYKFVKGDIGDYELVTKIVKETITNLGAKSMQDMGRVIGEVRGKVGQSADGSRISSLVKESLS